MGSTEDSHHCLAFSPNQSCSRGKSEKLMGQSPGSLNVWLVLFFLLIDWHNFPNVNQEPGSVPGPRV